MTGKPTNAGAPLLTYPRLRVKLATLSIEGYTLLTKVWLYVQDAGNGGRFHVDELPAAVDRIIGPAKLSKALDEVARAEIRHEDGTTSPLWLSVVDDWVQLPAWWLEINPGATVWQDETLRWRRARNKALHSPKFERLRQRVRTRDRNLCRYCGARVKWGSNNSPTGATYDHVDPDADNTFGNVVVSCRRCNGRKKDRTPEQWCEDAPGDGLTLLPAGTLAADAAPVHARAGPNPSRTRVEPGSIPASRPRARPSRVEPESNPNRTDTATASPRPDAGSRDSDRPPTPTDDDHREGETSS